MKRIEILGYFDPKIKIPWFYILPNGTFIKVWNFIILIFCLYSNFLIPLELGMFLLYELEKNKILNFYFYVEYLISILLLIDILFTLITPVNSNQGELITNWKKIIEKYLNEYFFIELITIFPIDIIFNQNLLITDFYILLLMKIPRFLRIIKISRQFFNFSYPVLKIISLFFAYYLIAHYFSCALCYTSANVKTNYFLDKNSIYEFLKNNSLISLYTRYVNLSILILVGNNEDPEDIQQRVLIVIMFYIGTLTDALIFSNMAIMFTKTNELVKNKIRKEDELIYLLNVLNVNPKVQKEIMDYYDLVWWKHRDKFLNKKFKLDLNRCLQTRIILIKLNFNLFEVSPIFEKFSFNFITKFANSVNQIITHPNDILTFEGSNCDNKLYFISKDGKFSVRINGNIIKILFQGYFFGEVSYFLKSKRRIATVVSINISILYYIDYSILNHIFLDFPFEAKEFFSIAVLRFKESFNIMDNELKNKIIQTNSYESIWNDEILLLLNNINI